MPHQPYRHAKRNLRDSKYGITPDRPTEMHRGEHFPHMRCGGRSSISPRFLTHQCNMELSFETEIINLLTPDANHRNKSTEQPQNLWRSEKIRVLSHSLTSASASSTLHNRTRNDSHKATRSSVLEDPVLPVVTSWKSQRRQFQKIIELSPKVPTPGPCIAQAIATRKNFPMPFCADYSTTDFLPVPTFRLCR